MTHLSPTALEAAAKAAYDVPLSDGDPFGTLVYMSDYVHPGSLDDMRRSTMEILNTVATAAITAYLAQAGKEGWVMVRGAEVDGLRSALKGLSDMYAWTWDKVDGGLMMSSSGVERFEKAHQRAYEVLYPDRPLISEDDDEAAAAQNGEDLPAPPMGK